MEYRREIDGLRTVAVVPVILCHAGMSLFSGGFIGVDIFFVISGYLITTIIVRDLDAKRFSLLDFYERRARRILPALFLVMAATLPFAYRWIMPDELKNYGQSLVATALFSNNILLALTSGYWSTASEFKPLLHSWSLGVEEQYYFFFPLLMIAVWRFAHGRALPVMLALFIASLVAAAYGVAHYPDVAFYILPTRGWELLAGAMLGHALHHGLVPTGDARINQFASLTGLLLIAGAVVTFDGSYLSPGPWSLVPVAGAVLIIAGARPGTLVHWLLSTRIAVGIGLISYSLYLWHQPLFAFARIHAVDPPGPATFALLTLATGVLAWLTWRFVEAPFRDRRRVGRRALLTFSLIGSASLILAGLYIARTYGMAWRIFGPDVSVADIDKRIYNERAFAFKRSGFTGAGDRWRVLVTGNSFGRDVVNMTLESFPRAPVDIVYRDVDICDLATPDAVLTPLLRASDIIIVAGNTVPSRACVDSAAATATGLGKRLFVIGTKNFGYNLNWIMRLPAGQRADRFNRLPATTIAEERAIAALVPPAEFISVLAPIVRGDRVPITDAKGRMLSVDRLHLTKYGAAYVGRRALVNSAFGRMIAGPPPRRHAER